MTYDEYAALPGLNATLLKRAATSMAHAKAYLDSPDDIGQKPSVRWGRISHGAILEPIQFFKTAVHGPDCDKRSKEWKDFTAAHKDADILTADEYAKLTQMSERIQACRDAWSLIADTRHELSVTWETMHYGAAKARLDGFGDGKIVEYKTTSCVDAKAFAKQVERSLRYDIGAGWYSEWHLNKTNKMPDFYFIVQESNPPYHVQPYHVPADLLPEWRRMAVEVAELYRACEARREYPGPTSGMMVEYVPLAELFDAENGMVDMSGVDGDEAEDEAI